MQKVCPIFDRAKKQETGIALILSVFILANLFIISFIVADIVVRIGKSGHDIGQSEIAYLAAETAIEKSIFHIEAYRNVTGLGTESDPDDGTLSYNTGGTWLRYASAIESLSPICVDNSQGISYPDIDPDDGEHSCIYSAINNQVILNDNPLFVHLQSGKTFQFELDIIGISYPNYLTVSWQNNHSGQAVILDLDEDAASLQTVYDTDEVNQFTVPKDSSLSGSQRFKIVNNSSSDIIYTITPALSDFPMPVGILMHAEGQFGTRLERILDVERRNWQIY